MRFLLFAYVLLVFFTAFDSFALVDGNKTVGILVTAKEQYEYEIPRELVSVKKMLVELGASIVDIDYNKLVKDAESSKLPIDMVVEDFLTENKITKVFIPGNYYNFDLPPYPPTPNRQSVTEIFTKMANDKKIHLMGICGGMQAILHTEGIKIVNIEKEIKHLNKDKVDVIHIQEYPIKDPSDLHLARIKVSPASKAASIFSNVPLEKDKQGWISIYLPHIHSEAIDSSDPKNIDKLLASGYSPVGFADDGIIEIVEDRNGNIHFQSHPDILLAHMHSIMFTDQQKSTIDAMKKIMIDFINKN